MSFRGVRLVRALVGGLRYRPAIRSDALLALMPEILASLLDVAFVAQGLGVLRRILPAVRQGYDVVALCCYSDSALGIAASAQGLGTE